MELRAEYFPSMCEAGGSAPQTNKQKQGSLIAGPLQ